MKPDLKHFAYQHLPGHLAGVSKIIHDVAQFMEKELPECSEKDAGMRKLLEAKDAFVRAKLES